MGSAREGNPRRTHNRGKDAWVSTHQINPNAKAHDQIMVQWSTERHQNVSRMPREARQLTDVNVSVVNPSRARA